MEKKDWTGNKNSIFKTLGASNHTDQEREKYDYYATSPIAAELLLKEETFSKKIWECACVDEETEVLTKKGWIKIGEYDKYNSEIMVCNSTNDIPSKYETPIEFIQSKSEFMFEYSNSFLSMNLSSGHRVLYYNNHNVLKTKIIDDIYKRHSKSKYGFKGAIPTAFTYSGYIRLDEWHLRLAIACQADGTCRCQTTNRYTLSIKKKRKKERIIYLLNKCGVKYKRYERGDYSIFVFKSKYGCKTFPYEWYELCDENKRHIIDEVFRWDGTATKGNIGNGSCAYYTTNKKNADFIQFCISSMGMQSNIIIDKRECRKPCFRVSILNRKKTWIFTKNGKHDIIKVHSNSKCYCFKTSTGYFLCRRNGRIFVTGNCGEKHLSGVFEKHGYNVRSSDLIDRCGNEVYDFLDITNQSWKAIL